ncbi:hypothetical protein CBM2634_B70012 [Cupriavidus taiwanensis]|uniref:Uncharacterized protein n=1 Tax=Cupriavidus taiwanensis TaxID=164546 RepID=A0A375JAY9_9BURK|nr:hypothetical protein CBM2634_B70012 [Cupriavidus taiwanensis]
MVAGSIGTCGHYSRAPCTLKFGFAKERLRGGLGGQQASQRGGATMQDARRTGRAGVARGAPVEGWAGAVAPPAVS